MTAAPASFGVISGLGAVSAWGVGREALWRGLLAPDPAIGPLSRFAPEGYTSGIAAQCRVDRRALQSLCGADADASRADLFALAAAREALAQAGLRPGAIAGRVGVYFGGSTGGLAESEDHYQTSRLGRPGSVSLRPLMAQPVSNPAEEVARHCGADGPVVTVSSACASGTLALGLALEALRSGDVDVAVAGGSDSLARTTFGGFNSLQSVDRRPCRPFRADREGLTLGEGGAVLVVERHEHLAARGGQPLARLMGTGSASDAHHMTAPHPEGEGALAAMEECLRDAGMSADAVDFINAHGTGTPLNDRAEFNALRRLFADRIRTLPVVASKSGTGHLLGSAGVLEAVVTVLCLQHQQLHPAPRTGPVDPEAAVDLVQDPGGRDAPVQCGMSLSLGFGGSNAAAVFARCESA